MTFDGLSQKLFADFVCRKNIKLFPVWEAAVA